jgi:hypothetical protein
MGRRLVVKEIKIHDELCGDCFYNEEGVCNKNPEKCIYNLPPVDEEDEEDEEEDGSGN